MAVAQNETIGGLITQVLVHVSTYTRVPFWNSGFLSHSHGAVILLGLCQVGSWGPAAGYSRGAWLAFVSRVWWLISSRVLG